MALPKRYNEFSDVYEIRNNWGWFLTLGIVLVLLGTFAIGASVYTTFFTLVFLGVLLLAGGIAKLIYSFFSQKWSGFFISLLIGLLYAVTGGFLVFKPVASAAALTLLIGYLFLVSGLFKIIVSIFSRLEGWGWILFSGIVSVVLGVLVLQEWPQSSLWLIGLFVGIDLLIYGWSTILFSLVAKRLNP